MKQKEKAAYERAGRLQHATFCCELGYCGPLKTELFIRALLCHSLRSTFTIVHYKSWANINLQIVFNRIVSNRYKMCLS